jgi:hypothetical protein
VTFELLEQVQNGSSSVSFLSVKYFISFFRDYIMKKPKSSTKSLCKIFLLLVIFINEVIILFVSRAASLIWFYL